jgi:hypothetical protein
VSSLGSIRGMTTFVIACVALDVQLRSLVRSPTAMTTTLLPLLYQDTAPRLLNGTDNISFDPILGIPIVASSRTAQSSPHENQEEVDDDRVVAEPAAATDGSVERRREVVNGT